LTSSEFHPVRIQEGPAADDSAAPGLKPDTSEYVAEKLIESGDPELSLVAEAINRLS
jgi:hypothetical protein